MPRGVMAAGRPMTTSIGSSRHSQRVRVRSDVPSRPLAQPVIHGLLEDLAPASIPWYRRLEPVPDHCLVLPETSALPDFEGYGQGTAYLHPALESMTLVTDRYFYLNFFRAHVTAEYALLAEDELAAAERRRTVSSGAACSALLFRVGP